MATHDPAIPQEEKSSAFEFRMILQFFKSAGVPKSQVGLSSKMCFPNSLVPFKVR